MFLIWFLVDSDCPDICVVGGCSSSCSETKTCPDGYSCMSGRCFAKCDLSEQARGESVCGINNNYHCLVGLSEEIVGTGLCKFKADNVPTTELVRLLSSLLFHFKCIVSYPNLVC